MADEWEIQIWQLPIVGGVASHSFWTLTIAKGATTGEIQGVSTRSDGTVAAVGGPLNRSDTLNWYVLGRGDLSHGGFKLQVQRLH